MFDMIFWAMVYVFPMNTHFSMTVNTPNVWMLSAWQI